MKSVVELPTAAEVSGLVAAMWTSLLGETDAPVVLASAQPPAHPRTPGAVVAWVSTTGAWTGHLVLALSLTGADHVARAMFGAEDVQPMGVADVADAVGEMGNIIAGNIKAILPEPSTLSLPQVVVDAGAFSLPDAHLRVTATLDWRGETIIVSLWETSAAGKGGT